MEINFEGSRVISVAAYSSLTMTELRLDQLFCNPTIERGVGERLMAYLRRVFARPGTAYQVRGSTSVWESACAVFSEFEDASKAAGNILMDAGFAMYQGILVCGRISGLETYHGSGTGFFALFFKDQEGVIAWGEEGLTPGLALPKTGPSIAMICVDCEMGVVATFQEKGSYSHVHWRLATRSLLLRDGYYWTDLLLESLNEFAEEVIAGGGELANRVLAQYYRALVLRELDAKSKKKDRMVDTEDVCRLLHSNSPDGGVWADLFSEYLAQQMGALNDETAEGIAEFPDSFDVSEGAVKEWASRCRPVVQLGRTEVKFKEAEDMVDLARVDGGKFVLIDEGV